MDSHQATVMKEPQQEGCAVAGDFPDREPAPEPSPEPNPIPDHEADSCE